MTSTIISHALVPHPSSSLLLLRALYPPPLLSTPLQVIDSRIRVGQSVLAMSEVVVTEDSPLDTRSSGRTSSNLQHQSSAYDDDDGRWMVSTR